MSLATSLTLYLKADEASGTRTESVAARSFTDHNTVGSGTGLVYGTAADFEQDNEEYLDCPSDSNLQGNQEFTAAAFVKLESDANGEVLGKGDGSGWEYDLNYTSGGTQRWRWRVESGAAVVDDGGGFGGGSAPSLGTWALVVVGYRPAANEIWIATSTNSFTKYTSSYSGGVTAGSGNFAVGRASSFFPSYFDGLIGPVLFWTGRTLSDADITELWNGGAGVTYEAIAGGGGGKPAHYYAMMAGGS